jgi:dihydrofolate reductase
MIAAMASSKERENKNGKKNRVIGKENAMPWHLPADFAWFKRHTLNKPILMGRKTFESIGRPLPFRQNIVITQNKSWQAEGVEVVHSIEQGLKKASKADEVMIIGGASIYEACLELADCLYLTFIDAKIEGDAYFPDWGEGWQQIHIEKRKADDKNAHDMEFVILEKINCLQTHSL